MSNSVKVETRAAQRELTPDEIDSVAGAVMAQLMGLQPVDRLYPPPPPPLPIQTAQLLGVAPDVVAGEADVFPAERRDVEQEIIVDRAPARDRPPPGCSVPDVVHSEHFRVVTPDCRVTNITTISVSAVTTLRA